MLKFINKNKKIISALWVTKHDSPSDFYLSSWQRGESAIPMLVLRVLLSAFALCILSWSLVEGGTPHWLVYLTNWGVLIVVTTVLSGLAVSIAAFKKKQFDDNLKTTSLPWYVSLYWVAFNTTVTMSIIITALYWILLYNPANQEHVVLRLFWLDITTHGLTACIAVTELLMSRTPVKLIHAYMPLGLGLTYAVFSVIYYAAGGTDRVGNAYIYAVLNWAEPKSAVVVIVGAMVALVVLYLVLWCVAFMRNKLSTTFVRTASHDLPVTAPYVTPGPKIV